MKNLRKTFAIAAATLGLACSAAPAFAGGATTMSLTIETSDINLATPGGQKLLDQRIERAARTVCRTTDLKTGTRVMNREARACLAKARVDARQQVATIMESRQRGG